MERNSKSKPSGFLTGLAIIVLVMGACTGACLLLKEIFSDVSQANVAIYILGVAVVSLCTKDYLSGIVASIAGVILFNYIFTYPYYKFEWTLSGYPVTFTIMLLVSIIISTLSTKVKKQQKAMYEAEAEKMRANLYRAMGHDIRTPLASIVGSSSILLAEQDMPETARRELLAEMNKDAQWLSRVTENILSVTKFSAEGVRLKLTEEVAEEIIGSAIVQFRKTDSLIAVHVDKPEDIVLVPMEATLIKQVLINLLDNVVSHGEGASEIVISLKPEDDRVIFAVRDNGAGIRKDVLPHMFDGGCASSDRSSGDTNRNMGIGLSVCNSIVMAHGGKMWAENNNDGGATVAFWLPAGKGNTDEHPR